MAITQTMTTSFKKELFEAVHNFTSHTIKIALYDSTATLDADTTAFGGAGELDDGVGGYSTGGNTLTKVAPASSGTSAFISFDTTTWGSSTFTARGALIYNDTQSDKSVCVLDFGSDKTATAGDFTIVFPTADASNAIIRIA